MADDRKLIFKRTGDNLEVKVMDSSFNMYFKKRVNVSDRKAMRVLLKDLYNLGIDFKKILGDVKSEDQWW